MLFGINWGGVNPPKAPMDWTNFHTMGHRGDGSLRNSVRMAYETFGLSLVPPEDGARLPSAYMTDVFKQIPTPNAAKLRTTIKRESDRGIDHVGRCAELLREELILCLEGAGGGTPRLVAMGQAAYAWLSNTDSWGPIDPRMAAAVDGALGDGAQHAVERMPHYTFGAASNVQRRDALAAILAKMGSGPSSS